MAAQADGSSVAPLGSCRTLEERSESTIGAPVLAADQPGKRSFPSSSAGGALAFVLEARAGAGATGSEVAAVVGLAFVARLGLAGVARAAGSTAAVSATTAGSPAVWSSRSTKR